MSLKKNLYKIFGYLLNIGSDKYLHFITGSLVTSLIYIVSLLICPAIVFWIPLLTSFIVVFALALIKDFMLDAYHDWWDIVCTMLGWLFIFLNYLVII